MLLDRFGQSKKFCKKSLKKIGASKFEYSQGHLGDNVLATSRIHLPGVSLERQIRISPLDVISGRPQDVRLGRPQGGQIGSLGEIPGTLKGDVLGTSWGPIFARWEALFNYNEKAKEQN